MMDLISRKDCEELLKKVPRYETHTLDSFTIKLFGDTTTGFLGTHYKLTLNIHSAEGKEEQTSFFVKTKPNVQAHLEYMEEIGIFEKEALFCNKVLPELQKVTEFLDYAWSPKCLLARNGVLVFEDLTLKKYNLADGRGIFGMNNCTAALKTLANLHSASMIWEHINKEKINEKYPDVVKECTYIHKKGHCRYFWMNSAIKALEYLCVKMNKNSKSISYKVKKATANMGPIDSKINVLSHADLWGNNFMFHEDINGKIDNCILIDYQLTRYSPCSYDLLSCIYLTTSLEFRRQFYKQLVQVYHKRMTEVLSSKGIAFMTIEELLQECEPYRLTAVVEACLFGITIWLPSKLSDETLNDPDKCRELILGDRTWLMEEAYTKDEFFRKQMSDLIGELVEYNL